MWGNHHVAIRPMCSHRSWELLRALAAPKQAWNPQKGLQQTTLSHVGFHVGFKAGHFARNQEFSTESDDPSLFSRIQGVGVRGLGVVEKSLWLNFGQPGMKNWILIVVQPL